MEAAAHGKAPPTSKVCDAALCEPTAAFVTLESPDSLRGCIGTLTASAPLHQAVAEMAHAAASRDPRFPPIVPEEISRLTIEISVLGPLQPLEDPTQLIPGKHGLIVSRGPFLGTLLPQVATHYGWGREEFIRRTCLKAGLPGDAWQRGAQLAIFTAEVFGGPAAESETGSLQGCDHSNGV